MSELVFKLHPYLISLKNFLEKTFVPLNESDTGLFMRINRNIEDNLFPISFAHMKSVGY